MFTPVMTHPPAPLPDTLRPTTDIALTGSADIQPNHAAAIVAAVRAAFGPTARITSIRAAPDAESAEPWARRSRRLAIESRTLRPRTGENSRP